MVSTVQPRTDELLDFSLTPEQAHLIELAETLSRERIAPRARKYDTEAIFPTEDFKDLFQHRLTALNVPVEYGGLGVHPLVYALILKHIGRANGSTGLALNMHSTVQIFLNRIASEEQRRRYFGEIVREGALLASVNSEPNISYRGAVTFESTAERVPGGYRVNGLKHFCSLSTDARYYAGWATPPGLDFLKNHLYLMILSDSPGIELIPTWDTLSMRGTASHTLRFTDVLVPDEHVVGQPGELLATGVVDRFSLGYCAVYLGVAEAAYEFTHEFAATKRFAPDPNPVSHQTIVQMRVAEMSVLLEAANLMLRRAAMAVAAGDDRERTLALNQAKYYVGEVALQVTDHALKVVGGRAILRQYDLERFIRDARTAPVMPPAGDRCLETTGKLLFNLSASMFDLK